MNIKLIVASHKKYRMPEDEIYLPIFVGAAGKEDIGYTRDDTGDNISAKNPYFCELTGLYWAWKNLSADAVGLCHYRRHFAARKTKDKFGGLIGRADAEKMLQKADVIVPKKRKYYIETIYSHYVHTLSPVPLEITENIIKEKYQGYFPEFQRLKKRTSAHMFNMFIMKREVLERYCEFLFGVLFELEKRVPQSEYEDKFGARFFGRISEILLDVFLFTEKISYAEAGYVNIEGEKWHKKIAMFLSSKFFGKKYGKSI